MVILNIKEWKLNDKQQKLYEELKEKSDKLISEMDLHKKGFNNYCNHKLIKLKNEYIKLIREAKDE